MPPVLKKALNAIGEPGASSFLEHLKGGTSANYLSNWLRRAGHPVSATTLKAYRKEIA
jgi:hypothetical protein